MVERQKILRSLPTRVRQLRTKSEREEEQGTYAAQALPFRRRMLQQRHSLERKNERFGKVTPVCVYDASDLIYSNPYGVGSRGRSSKELSSAVRRIRSNRSSTKDLDSQYNSLDNFLRQSQSNISNTNDKTSHSFKLKSQPANRTQALRMKLLERKLQMTPKVTSNNMHSLQMPEE